MWQKAPNYSYIADAVRAGKTASLGLSWGIGKYSERRTEHPVRWSVTFSQIPWKQNEHQNYKERDRM